MPDRGSGEAEPQRPKPFHARNRFLGSIDLPARCG
jgi:hypothetical protein